MRKMFYMLSTTNQINGFVQKIFVPMYVKLCIGIFLFSFSQNAISQVTTEIDTTRIRIGEQIQFQIIVDEIDQVKFSNIRLDSLKRIEVVESFKIDSLRNRLIKKYSLTRFDSGRYMLPGQTVFIRDKKFLTDSLIIDVATVAVDTIKQPMYTIKEIRNETVKKNYKNNPVGSRPSLMQLHHYAQ